MRFGQHLLQNPHLKRFQDANAVFLDTTYCNPKYTFPPQEEAVQYVATTVDRLLKEQQQQWLKRIYVISTYVIGKERLLVAIHKLTGCKIGVTQQKMDTMKCLELPGVDLDEVFTTDLSSTPVHVAKWGFLGESWPFFRPNFVNMEQYKTDMNVDEVVGFVPTGWMYEMKRKAFPVREKGSCFIHLVPYSEHSSYSELREYVRFLKPHKVLPTVGVHADDASGKKSAGMQKHFRHLVNETASKQRFLRSLHRSSSAKEPSGSLPPSVKEEPDLKEEELALSGSLPPKVKEEPGLKEEEHAITDQSGIRHEPSGKGMSSIKQEPSTSTGPGIKQESGAFSCDEVMAAQQRPDSQAARDLAVSAGLPESLGEELGDAACLKADPDSLMQDALTDPPSLSAPPPAANSRAEAAVRQGSANADSPQRRQQHQYQSVVSEFLSILGGDISADTARTFVTKAGGNLAVAINSFYDNAPLKVEEPGHPGRSAENARATSSETSAESIQQGADAGVFNGIQKQAGQPQASKPKTKGRKRGVAAPPEGTGDGPSKKAKPSDAAQRSIAAFFGGQQTSQVKTCKPAQQQSLCAKNGAVVTGQRPSQSVSADLVEHTVKSEDMSSLPGHAVAVPSQTQHVDTIDLVEDTVHVKTECMTHDTVMTDGDQSKAKPAAKVELLANGDRQLPVSNGQLPLANGQLSQRSGQQFQSTHQAALSPQPLHPFFGKRQASKSASTTAKPADSMSSDQAAQGMSMPILLKQSANAEEKSSRVNPFQKAQIEPDRDVAADAVLLSTSEYDPVGMAVWQAGQATPYRHISRAFQAMESTTKRLRIGDAIANMFRSILALSPEDMLQAAYLTIGKLAPDYENVELSVGGSTVAAAVVEATGTSRAKLREMYNELGDLGDTMLHRPAPLTVAGVYKTLRQIAVQKGQGSAARRQQAVLGMLRSCREHETKFLVRTLVSNLRVGANWRSVIGAMARAVVLHREGPRVPKARLDAAATAASEAYHVCPNLDILVPALVEGGIDELEKRCALTPGVPLKPMLAKISEGIPDAIKQLKGAPFLAEYKYDGTRAQIHLLSDNSVKVFSRNCEDKTASMPDVVAAIQAAAQGGSTSLVLDAELVAIDRADGNRLKAFQELSTRARGQIAAHQASLHCTAALSEICNAVLRCTAGVLTPGRDVPALPAASIEVTMHVCVFVFDLLYVDGDSLVHLPLRQRRARLAAALPNLQPGHVQFATSMEFQPAAVSAAAAAAVDGSGPAAAAVGTDPSISDIEAGVGDDVRTGVVSSASSFDSLRHQDDREFEVGHQCADNLAHGGGDINATDVAAATAAEAAADASGVQEEDQRFKSGIAVEGAADAEGAVSDLALQSIEDRIQEFLLESFAGGTEGLMLKALDVAAGYQPSKRSDSWIKLKRDYCEGLRDSLDLVVIGAWQGQGRKVKWFSPFLLAAWDPEAEEYQSVCRCMSGFTDAFYADATTRFKATAIPAKKPYYRTNESPDVWFEPTEVWEIRGADLTISPVHKAAVGHIHPDRGISLRFPRFITSRNDKRPEDASTPDVIVDLYNKQSRRMTSAAEMLANKSKAKTVKGAHQEGASDQEGDDHEDEG
ncbi:MAG: DNA ligase [Trebouxia sp. A1-2]|nr:MAG: DNA ligase [Trebouxia sp. A1-2]